MKNFKRNLAVDKTIVDGDDRIVELSFSSETPYEREYGFEVLSHDEGAINFERILADAPLLFNHDPDKPLGKVLEAYLDVNKKVGRAKVKFSKNLNLANEIYPDVIEGMMKNVSFMYSYNESDMEKIGTKDGVPVFKIKKYTPAEISIVTIPADFSIGVGRSFDLNEMDKPEEENKEEEKPEEEVKQGSDAEGIQPETTECLEVVEKNKDEEDKPSEDVVDNDKERLENIKKLEEEEKELKIKNLEKLGNENNASELVQELIKTETYDEKSFWEKLAKTRESSAISFNNIKTNKITGTINNMDKKDLRKYSPGKAILQNSQGKLDGVEAEVQQEMVRKYGANKTPNSVYYPFAEISNAKRDHVAGDPVKGGYSVDEETSSSMIEFLRAKRPELANVTMYSGLQGNIHIPRQNSSEDATWQGEVTAVSPTSLTLDEIILTPKRLSKTMVYSDLLSIQSLLPFDQVLKNDIVEKMAEKLAYTTLHGSGTGEPRGIFNRLAGGGFGNVSVYSNGTDGGSPDYDSFTEIEAILEEYFTLNENSNILTTAKVKAYLKSIQRFSNTDGEAVWDRENKVNTYNAFVSNLMRKNFTKGAGTGLHGLAQGDWKQIIWGEWGVPELQYNPYTGMRNAQTEVTMHMYTDMAVRHDESFIVMNDIVVPA